MTALFCPVPPLQAFHHPRTAKSAASSKEKAKGNGSESQPSNLDSILGIVCMVALQHASPITACHVNIACFMVMCGTCKGHLRPESPLEKVSLLHPT